MEGATSSSRRNCFKAVNDTLGHNTGDALLKAVSKTIKNNIRATDTPARLGGDEFVLLLPETEAEAARNFVHKLNKLLLNVMQKNNWKVTFSMGRNMSMTLRHSLSAFSVFFPHSLVSVSVY